eukprot:gene63320-86615_t
MNKLIATLIAGLFASAAMAQTPAPSGGTTSLPAIEVDAPKRAPARKPRARVATGTRRTTPAQSPSQATVPPALTAAESVAAHNNNLDAARNHINAPGGASVSSLSRDQIQAQPQGANASLDKVLLQFPGVSQDSAASGDLHVRNEHAN